jgi:hypothetical protein
VRVGSDVYEWQVSSHIDYTLFLTLEQEETIIIHEVSYVEPSDICQLTHSRNLMMGTKYLEHTGEMVISNTTTGARCSLEFLEAGYWSPPNVVKGTVYTSAGQATTTLEGKWDEQLARKLNDSHLHVLWRIAPFPKNSREFYGFTSFGITLHECTPDLEGKLPPTDSRLRPDVTALERGDLDTAESEKLRVEEAQRERRRAGKDVQPRWFKKVGEEDWEYTGGYWEQREQGWHDIQPLW